MDTSTSTGTRTYAGQGTPADTGTLEHASTDTEMGRNRNAVSSRSIVLVGLGFVGTV